MARKARGEVVDPTEVQVFHVLNRTVRRCWLFGDDPLTGINYNHRKDWIEERGGRPAVVADTHDRHGSGILRVDFPGFSGEHSLEEVEWEEFFEIFEDRSLAFLYQESTRDGSESRFFKFIDRAGSEASAR